MFEAVLLKKKGECTYFLKTEKLAAEIKADTISETAKKNYYIGASIITLAMTYLYVVMGTTNAAITLLDGLAAILMMVVGVNITFKTNGDVDYIARIVILSFPLLFKMCIIAISIGLIVGIGSSILNLDYIASSPWVNSLINVVVQILFYWRLNVHLINIRK